MFRASNETLFEALKNIIRPITIFPTDNTTSLFQVTHQNPPETNNIHHNQVEVDTKPKTPYKTNIFQHSSYHH